MTTTKFSMRNRTPVKPKGTKMITTETQSLSNTNSTKFVLREYQEKARNDTLDALETVQRVMCSLPTGAGKTVIGRAIIDEYLKQHPGARVRVLVHRRELKKQWGLDLDIQTIQKVSRKGYKDEIKFNTRDLLVVDEAHHIIDNTWAKYVEKWHGKVIGLTATPYRADPTVALRSLWNKLVIGATKQELIELGYLLPAKLIDPPFAYRIEGAGEDSFGDYSASATMELYRTSDLQRQAMVDESVKWLIDIAPKSKTIVFCMNTFHADLVRQYINLNTDRTAVCITAQTPMDIREAIMAGFEAGLFDTLLTVAVLTEGIDLPIADTALILRPTLSLSLYLQMIGRVVRPYNGLIDVCWRGCKGTKQYGRILDATNNFNEFGHPDDEFVWTLDAREKDYKKVWLCPQCEFGNAIGTRECEKCGFSLNINAKKKVAVKRVACAKCGSWVNAKTGMCDKCTEKVITAPNLKDKPAIFKNRNLVWTKIDYDGKDAYTCNLHTLGLNLFAIEQPNDKEDKLSFTNSSSLKIKKPEKNVWKGRIEPEETSFLWEVGGYINYDKTIKFAKYTYKSPLRLLNALTNAVQEMLDEYEYVVDVFAPPEQDIDEHGNMDTLETEVRKEEGNVLSFDDKELDDVLNDMFGSFDQ